MNEANLQAYINRYFVETEAVLNGLDRAAIRRLIEACATVRREGGRLFLLGVGGSAANASHAVNDFRKIAGIEAYAPTDNVSELTARTNDDSWADTFAPWLKTSRLGNRDAIFILSVGGGSSTTSANLVKAIDLAKEVGAKILGIVGRDGGYTAAQGDAVVVIPPQADDTITPLAEAFQGLLWHLVVTALAREI
ncbi:MAG: SIS domain-containing protein [Candidatus Zipacnadales bacterium]